MTVILPRSSEVILDTGLQYYVQNNTEHRLVTGDRKTDLLRYNKVVYRCEPGEKVIVPWAVVALYFGDPRSQHDKSIEAEDSQGTHVVPPRGNELQRLSIFYGVYEQGVDSLPNVVPDVSIFTLDGVEIVPPCFDPEGDFLYGYNRSVQKTGDVATILEQMREAQNDLNAKIERLEQAQAAREIYGDNDGEIPTDNPIMP